MDGEVLMNFDEARDAREQRPSTFQIGGETFTFIRGLRPEHFAELIADYAALPLDAKTLETVPVVDATICSFLKTEADRKRWAKVRARKTNAITAGDMRRVLFWLIEEQTDRPTEAPSSSGDGRETTGERSTDRSSLRPVASGG